MRVSEHRVQGNIRQRSFIEIFRNNEFWEFVGTVASNRTWRMGQPLVWDGRSRSCRQPSRRVHCRLQSSSRGQAQPYRVEWFLGACASAEHVTTHDDEAPRLAPRLFGWACALIAIAAFFVRLAYLQQIEGLPFFHHPIGDVKAYWEWSGRIAAGEWMGDDAFYQAPGYPYFLAVVQRITGDDLWRVRLVQIGLGSISCALLALAGRWFFSASAGLWAGAIMALYGPAIFFAGLIQKAGLGLLLMSGALALMGRLAAQRGDGGREHGTLTLLGAVIEIVSSGNKSGSHALRTFVEKAADLLRQGINLLIVDLFPPSPRDPQGIHKAIWDEIAVEPFELPADKPLTVAAYSAGELKTAYVEPVAVGDDLPALPIFLDSRTYVPAPLEETYRTTWSECPDLLREIVPQA